MTTLFLKKAKIGIKSSPKKETKLVEASATEIHQSRQMNTKQLTATMTLILTFSTTTAWANGFSNLCQEDGANAGLTGTELSDYVDSCLSQYGADEPTYDEYQGSEENEDFESPEYIEEDNAVYSEDNE